MRGWNHRPFDFAPSTFVSPATRTRRVAEYEEHLRRDLAKYLGREDIDDVLQTVWVKCMTSPPDPSQPIRRWLHTLARNKARDLLRRTRAASLGHDPAGEDTTPLDDLIQAETGERLRSLVDGLREGDRDAVTGVYFAGSMFAEAAADLEIPLGSLKTRIHRGLKSLRCRLDDAA